MELFSISGVLSDCTVSYHVEFTEKEDTVEKFLKSMLKHNSDWGFVNVVTKDKKTFSIEYSYGVLKTNFAPDISKRKIRSALANGAYSRMDYELFLEEDSTIE